MSTSSRGRFLDPSTPPHLVTLVLLAGLSALAMNVFLPSLPQMTAYFDTEYRLMQLSVAIYLGVNAALQILIGPISDKLGRRPVILWGVALFMLATLGCIFATNITLFLLFRMCQAVIVTAMVLSRAVVRDMVGQEEAASMIAYVTMGVAVVPMVGPVIGGALGELLGWKAIFWLLFALGGAVFWLSWRDLGETSVSSGLSLAAQFREYPELLKSPRFWGYAMACALSSGAFFSYLGGAPFVGSEVYGLSPASLGVHFGAPAVGYFIGNGISGRYSARIGLNRMILWLAAHWLLACACVEDFAPVLLGLPLRAVLPSRLRSLGRAGADGRGLHGDDRLCGCRAFRVAGRRVRQAPRRWQDEGSGLREGPRWLLDRDPARRYLRASGQRRSLRQAAAVNNRHHRHARGGGFSFIRNSALQGCQRHSLAAMMMSD